MGRTLAALPGGGWGSRLAVSALLFSGEQNFLPIFSVHSSKKLGHLQSAFFPKRWFLLTWVYVVTAAGTLASALADKLGWRLWGHMGRRLPQEVTQGPGWMSADVIGFRGHGPGGRWFGVGAQGAALANMGQRRPRGRSTSLGFQNPSGHRLPE